MGGIEGSAGTRTREINPATAGVTTASESGGNASTQSEGLPQPAATGGVELTMTSIVLLMERSLFERKKGADAARAAAEKAQEEHELQAVNEMRKEAQSVFTGAITSGMISVAGGAVQVAGAGLAAHGVSLESKSTDLAKEAEHARQAGMKGAELSARNLQERASTIGAQAKRLGGDANVLSSSKGIFDGSAKGADGIYQSDAKEHQASQAQHNNAAQAAGRQARDQGEMSSDLGDLEKKTLARLEALMESEHQARMALIQRA